MEKYRGISTLKKDSKMTKKIKAGIIGATGYAGAELVRLLCGHPQVKIEAASSKSFFGEEISEIYPGYTGSVSLVLERDPSAVINSCDVIFAALPHGYSEGLGHDCLEKEKVFIDLGADFRLENEEDYKKWYGSSFSYKEIHKYAVYGLCEIFRDRIKNAQLIANPGCYPTSIALGLYPALKYGLIEQEGIIIDSKSGVTGGGRSMTQSTHFPECSNGFSAYKAGEHRHTPEIEQSLSKFAGKPVRVTFTPHLLPVNRGILSTIYCVLKTDPDSIRQRYREAYAGEPFVQVLADGDYANIRNVRLSNNCHISLHFDIPANRLIVCSAIDNMIKGAAGQAIQNMNIAFGIHETSGLKSIAPAF